MSADADLAFPGCCDFCPYHQRFTANCSHELRQSLIRDLSFSRSCPVFSAEKTASMRRLLDSL
jgi:hypothetical protein